MSRPRQNSNQLSAVNRMEDAFWELLAANSYIRMTVTDIVDKASVNRNSFYYHYDKLSDLARTAIEDAVEGVAKAMPELVDDPTESWRHIVAQVLGTPENSIHIDHLALVVSPNGNPDLLRYLRDAIRNSFIKGQHLDSHNLSLTSDMLLEFSTGGLISLISIWPRISKTVPLDQLVTIDAAVLARTLYLSISNKSMPDFWINLFKSTMQNHEHRQTNYTLADGSDEDFRNQVQALLDRTNANRKQSSQPNPYSPSPYHESDHYWNNNYHMDSGGPDRYEPSGSRHNDAGNPSTHSDGGNDKTGRDVHNNPNIWPQHDGDESYSQ